MIDDVIVLTGATDGLGRAVAERLAGREGTRLILHGRSVERLAALAEELRDAPATVDTVLADFADLTQVHGLADQIARLTDRVRVLVNNAGHGGGGPGDTNRELTADGNEMMFGVNHLAAFALTDDLMPLLERGAPARIVNIASIGQEPVDVDDLRFENDYSNHRAYTRSKFAMVATGFARARRLDPAKVAVLSIHPATMMPTKMVMQTIGRSIDTLEQGVDAVEHAVLAPALEGVSGEFFNGMELARARDEAYDEAVQEQLWEISAELTSRGARRGA